MPARPPFVRRPLVAALLLGPSLTLAQQPAQLADMEVSATLQDATAPTTTRTDADMLDKRFIRSFEDLGRRGEPGVNFNRVSESINIRGLDRDRVLTTIDGIRVPWMTDGARSQGPTGGAQGGLDSFDFNGLSAVDIVRGANSSQVGSGALGGAVQLFTLNPEDLLEPGKDLGSLIKTDYDSADHSWGLNAALAGRVNQTSWLLQGGQRKGHELESTGNDSSYGAQRTEANTADTEQQSLLVKLQQHFEGGHRVGFTGEVFEREKDIDTQTGQHPSTGPFGIGQNSTTESSDRQRLSLDYTYEALAADGLIDAANAVVYWQKSKRKDEQDAIRRTTPIGPFGRSNEIEKTLSGVNANLSKTLRSGSAEHNLRLGGEWYQITAEQYSSGYDNCPPAPLPPFHTCNFLHTNQADMPEAKSTQWALYLADEISLADGRVTLTPGLRYDAYKMEPSASSAYRSNANPNNPTALQDSNDSKLSASLLATWQITDQAEVYAQWAQGFKAPDPTQLYMNFGGVGTYLRMGNPDLKPEESSGFEVGTRLGNAQLGGSLSLFDNHYKNFIADSVAVDNATALSLGLNPASYMMGITRTENLAKVRIYGAESTAHWQFLPNWRLWGSLAWAEGKDRQTNQHLNSVAPLTTSLGLGYERERYGADLILTAAKARDKVENDSDFKAPGYGVLDLTAYWQPAALSGARLQAGVFNLLDKQYWNALNVPSVAPGGTLAQPDEYYSEAGRSFRAAVSWQF